MNTLKITAYHVDGTLHKSKYNSENEVPEEEMCHNSWWYLHGELQSEVGYDKAITTNCNSAGYSKETIDWSNISDNVVTEVFKDMTRPVMCVNGEIPVEVEGFNRPCIGFFWTEERPDIIWKSKKYPFWRQRGLVCFADDEEACAYARDLMIRKPLFY